MSVRDSCGSGPGPCVPEQGHWLPAGVSAAVSGTVSLCEVPGRFAEHAHLGSLLPAQLQAKSCVASGWRPSLPCGSTPQSPPACWSPRQSLQEGLGPMAPITVPSQPHQGPVSAGLQEAVARGRPCSHPHSCRAGGHAGRAVHPACLPRSLASPQHQLCLLCTTVPTPGPPTGPPGSRAHSPHGACCPGGAAAQRGLSGPLNWVLAGPPLTSILGSPGWALPGGDTAGKPACPRGPSTGPRPPRRGHTRSGEGGPESGVGRATAPFQRGPSMLRAPLTPPRLGLCGGPFSSLSCSGGPGPVPA